ncbi:MAG: MBL fold metallo-hydrolase [Acidobacteriota bacterium]
MTAPLGVGFDAFQITVMGCGTSTGVPVIGCDCPVCRSPDPKNKRMRSGLALRFGPRVILIDTSPDLRQQCLRFSVERVDAVLYTHSHADHIFGLDDLRPFNFRQDDPIACFGSAHTLGHLRRTFAYAFDGVPSEGGGKPRLITAEVEGIFEVFDLEIQALPVLHGSLEVTAYRIGPFAYVTDCHHIPDSTFEALRGTRILILDALRYEPHPTHFSVAEALDAARRIGAERTYLTHMNHDIDYNAPAVELPPGVELAYDGLTFHVSL